MALWQWSTTPANNASAGAIDWAEGQPPSTVNDSARQMMADVAMWFAAAEWLNYGLTPTYVSATQFSVTGNKTSTYSVGRRVRAFVTAGTIYGTVTASAFASVTTVTVAWSSGSLDSGVSEVDVGIMNPLAPSLPVGMAGSFSSLLSTTGLQVNSSGMTVANNQGAFLIWNEIGGTGATSLVNNQGIGSGGFVFRNVNLANTIETGRVAITAAGDLTASGNITAYSDERLKKDWQPLSADFIERLAALKRGTFTRIDSGERQVGVGAQSLQAFLPEAVQDGEHLSVAYGQAALVACAELAAEVVRLRALVEAK
jgi:hypothetical protein